MTKSHQEHAAIEAATEAWGITLDDLRNGQMSEELILMRQIVIAQGLYGKSSNKRISEIIDRSEVTVNEDLYFHRMMLEDKVECYIENIDLYEAHLEAIKA